MHRPGAWLLAAGLTGCGDAGGATTASTTTTTTDDPSSTTTGTPDPTTGGSADSTAADPTTSDPGETTAGLTCTPMATQPCYSGPQGTQDVGACVAGLQTCDDLGAGFGPCEGEVVPVDEACDTPADDDCDGEALDDDAGCLCLPGAATPCYDGQPDTANVGVCHDGTAVCAPTGAELGACEGQVVPGVEDCATPDDEDCDGATPPCAGAPQWAHVYGDASDAQGSYALTGLADGSSILGAHATGFIDFGTGPVGGADTQNVFLARFDPDGEAVWARSFPGDSGNFVFDVEADAAESPAIVGWFLGSVDLGGSMLASAGDGDLFVARYDAAGNHLWSKRFGGAGTDFGDGVGVGPDGEVLVAAHGNGPVNFGGGNLVPAGLNDVFLAKFSAGGTHLWSKRFGDAATQYITDVALGSNGDILITGAFAGTIDLGGGPLVSAGDLDLYVARLDPTGAHVWSKRFGDAASQSGQGLAVDRTSGAVAIAGTFQGTLDLGGGPLVCAGAEDAFLAVFAADGAHVWSRRFGDAADEQRGEDVDFAADGGVVATGDFGGTIDLGGGPLVTPDTSDLWVAKFSATGEHVFSVQGGASGYQQGFAVVADPTGAALVSGHFTETFELGPLQFVSAGAQDIFFAKLGP